MATKKATKTVVKEKSFSKLTKAEKRVAIAKDVLKWIKVGMIRPEHDGYFEMDDKLKTKIDSIEGKKELQELLPGTTCNVCAKGALFIADIMKRDNFTTKNLSFIGNCTIVKRLDGIFSENQLNLIETAFEKNIIHDNKDLLSYKNDEGYYHNSSLGQKAIDFGNKYDEPEERLIAIMKNIIKNKGTFKP